jgi:hypothetical protein
MSEMGAKPPADSIRVWTCAACRGRWLESPPGWHGVVTEHVYVPAGAEPDREAMVERLREQRDRAWSAYELVRNGEHPDLPRVEQLESELRRLRAEPDREAMAHLVMETLGQDEYGGDRIDGDEARNVVDALYPPKP